MTTDPIQRYLTLRYGALERRANLRPMGAGEVIDLALRIYQRIGTLVLKSTAWPTVFIFAGLAFLFQVVLPRFGVTQNAENIQLQLLEAIQIVAIALFVAAPVALFGLSYASAVVVKLTSDFVLGLVPDVGAAFRTASAAFRRLFLLNLYELVVGWSGVLVSLGLLMVSAYANTVSKDAVWTAVTSALAVLGFIAGFLILALILCRHALTPAVAVLEGRGPIQSAKRSVQLMASYGDHPSGYPTVWALMFLIAFLVLMMVPGFYMAAGLLNLEERLDRVFQIPIAGDVLGQLVAGLPLYLSLWIVVPMWCTTTTILYYERRVRLEALDIETLARDVYRTHKDIRFDI